MVDYIRGINVKESLKYGEYGSFEHLLFLFVAGLIGLGRGGSIVGLFPQTL